MNGVTRYAVAPAATGQRKMRPPDAVGHWPVLRAWPRTRHRALLELATPTGRRGGQWFADPAELAAAVSGTPGAEVVEDVLIHAEGVDAQLPALAGRLAAGDRIVVHRPGRRAVLRADSPDAPFTKVTRKRRASSAVGRHEVVRTVVGAAAHLPRILRSGPDWFTLSAVPGRTLLEAGRDGGIPARVLAGGWHGLGVALARMHAARPSDHPSLRATHAAAAERDTTCDWVDPVSAWGLLPGIGTGAAGQDAVAELLGPLTSQPPGPIGLLHRDLHDQQVLFEADAPERRIGLLDLDTVAWGEAALDLANILAHLDLRVRQDLLTPTRAAVAEEAFLTALAPAKATLSRVSAYRRAARLRLAAVYALRPKWRVVAHALLADVLAGR